LKIAIFYTISIPHAKTGKNSVGTPFHVDAAPGSVLIRSVAASGSELSGSAGSKLPLGSPTAGGALPLDATDHPVAISPREAAMSPRVQRSLSHVTPAARCPLLAVAAAAAAAADAETAGAPRLAVDHPSTDPKPLASAAG
jgi:hypothetical protein